MTEAETFATNLKKWLREEYPSEWLIEAGPWEGQKLVRLLLQNPEGESHTFHFQVEGFNDSEARNAVWTEFPPPSRTEPESDEDGES